MGGGLGEAASPTLPNGGAVSQFWGLDSMCFRSTTVTPRLHNETYPERFSANIKI